LSLSYQFLNFDFSYMTKTLFFFIKIWGIMENFSKQYELCM
jgi:hypothetical protein